MKIISDRSRSFDLDIFLQQPLFAHLSTASSEGPRESPVWFYWDGQLVWIIGTSVDSFPRRIQEDSRCAIGIIDFDHRMGKVHHAGFRGKATVEKFDPAITKKLFSKYLGSTETDWDPRFQDLDESNVLICFEPETVVVRDQSYIPSE